eukprot:1740635-Pleurochrysis_carterae.AAC.1
MAVARKLGRLEWADQGRAGQLPATLRGNAALARWRMDALCIGSKLCVNTALLETISVRVRP